MNKFVQSVKAFVRRVFAFFKKAEATGEAEVLKFRRQDLFRAAQGELAQVVEDLHHDIAAICSVCGLTVAVYKILGERVVCANCLNEHK